MSYRSPKQQSDMSGSVEVVSLTPNRYFLRHKDCPYGRGEGHDGRAFYYPQFATLTCGHCKSFTHAKEMLVIISLLDMKYTRNYTIDGTAVVYWEGK